ncbi:hypothetical protein MICAB_980003 [Microcystis aeruginosa PCC 9717]|uniref:Uncharacterized protein n=1 Tax=Microcystis aeruginosa PCC 9717 TaxID=1160286 RepID=I4FY05_MICAE|nr:hypothetical protein MICAB_980003 [Microcystis aeruginosa PCC 9717]
MKHETQPTFILYLIPPTYLKPCLFNSCEDFYELILNRIIEELDAEDLGVLIEMIKR